MSTTDYAASIIGCRVDRSKIFFKQKTRICDHSLPENYPNFCPECGKRTYLMMEVTIDEYDQDHKTLNGLRVFENEYSDQIIIAACSVVLDCDEWISCKLDPAHVSGSRTQLKKILKPLDLWDEEQFGIWCMMWAN